MGVFDPIIELKAKFTGVSLSAGAEVSKGVYECSPNEVLEVFRIEIVPPVDTATNTIKKLREVGLIINGEKYPYIHANSVMLPLEHVQNAGVAVDLGVPVTWTGLLGRQPGPFEATTIKLKEGDSLSVYAVAEEAITQDFEVVLKAVRVRGADELAKWTGGVYSFALTLDRDLITKPAIRIDPATFNELPGGKAQSKPAVYPWIVYARNKAATTVNTWYDFKYPDFVDFEWQNLSFNLVNKDKAYLVKYLGIIPHANSKAARFYKEGRETNPEFIIRPLPEQNFFPPAMFYDTTVNEGLKKAGPKKLFPEILFHGVKGGIQVIDNGTSIPANGVEVHVYGVLIEIK